MMIQDLFVEGLKREIYFQFSVHANMKYDIERTSWFTRTDQVE